tara:strand:- start:4153 stop:7734 length:3582 start_codon:yes stop_codon:yes gene_type:complete
MLNQYKNINEIVNSKTSLSGVRISNKQSEFFSKDLDNSYYFNDKILSRTNESRIEFHIYSNDTWISGNHKVNLLTEKFEYRDKNTNKSIDFPGGQVSINISKQLNDLKINAGNYRVAVNFFENLIGNYERQHLRIDEISSDRTELRLRAIDSDDPEFLQQITAYAQRPLQTSRKFYKTHLLNFSRNKCILFVNSVVIGEFLYVKLYEPLPADILEDFKCWVVEEQKPTFIDNIAIQSVISKKEFNSLSGPNWQANYSYDTSTETGLKSWTDLLGSSVQTSQQLIDTYFSSSFAGIDLNINYRDFNNFIFYSSAQERVENFKYKIDLLEHYSQQNKSISQLSGSVATTNANDFLTLRNTLIGGFDGFEKFLYHDSSSIITTHDITPESSNVTELTGSYITPVPKSNTTSPYELFAVSSSAFQNWYTDLHANAITYDNFNTNQLINAIPEYIRLNDDNAPIQTFVNMLGHHYDIIYAYITYMMKIHKREENPNLGMPPELLYSTARQFGWKLTDGRQNQNLWEYALGTNESGVPITGSNTIGDPSVAGKQITYSIWRRIVNNLPLLLKSKGTKRSVQALLSCYGIPQSMISINEYGGPRLERPPVYEKLNFDYALDLITNTAGTCIVNYSQSINTVELRFKTDNVITNPSLPSTMNLFSVGSHDVTLDFTRGTLGTIQINGTGSDNIELFDGDFLSTMLRTDGSNLEVVAKKSKYGKIVAAVSASTINSFDLSGSITIGGTSGGNRLQGQVQELRIWSSSLGDSAFNNHTKAPAAYDGNLDAYNELIFRVPLTQKIDHSATSSLSGVEPKFSGLTASFAGWSTNTPYDSIEETYYYDAISLAAGTFDDNKIRIENNELIGNLDPNTRAERSQFDKAPLDSKKLGVYFSPQTMINEDIIAQLGFTELDQYIGDPGKGEDKVYPDLKKIARDYWKKYNDKNDINAYVKIFTLFDLSFFRQLEQLLPARADLLSGILIQPNILERNKDTVLPDVIREDIQLNVSMSKAPRIVSGSFLNFSSSISTKIVTLSGSDDNQIQGYITASISSKYDGTMYSREYFIRSASTYTTSSTPYWMSDAVLPFFSSSVKSELRKSKIILEDKGIEFITQAGNVLGTQNGNTILVEPVGDIEFILAHVSDFSPRGIENQKYNGSKMTSPGFNINSIDTVDGGPVVEFGAANPNQLIYQTNGNEGSFRLS